MEQEEKTPTLVNHAIKWGVICGAIGIFMTVVLYAIDYSMLASFKTLGVMILIFLGIIIYAGIDYRKSVGGFLSYGKAWQHSMLTFAVSGVISVVFQILLYSVIDSELPAKLTDVIVDNTREMMENFGAPADQMDTALEKARTDSLDRLTPFGLMKGYIFQLIGYAVFSLIIALFTRKNPPVDQM